MKLGMFCLPAWDRRGGHFFAYFVLLVSKDAFDEF